MALLGEINQMLYPLRVKLGICEADTIGYLEQILAQYVSLAWLYLGGDRAEKHQRYAEDTVYRSYRQHSISYHWISPYSSLLLLQIASEGSSQTLALIA